MVLSAITVHVYYVHSWRTFAPSLYLSSDRLSLLAKKIANQTLVGKERGNMEESTFFYIGVTFRKENGGGKKEDFRHQQTLITFE